MPSFGQARCEIDLAEQGEWIHLDLPAIATEDQDIPLANGLTYRRK
jgi:hypothetical protein